MTIRSILMAASGDGIEPYFIGSSFAGIAAGSGTSLTVSKPSGVQVGDLLIAVCQAEGAVTWSGATGWTQAGTGGGPSLRIAYKVATTSEPSSYTFTVSSAIACNCHLLAFRCGAFDVLGAFGTSTSTTTVAPSVSASSNNSILLACFASVDGTSFAGKPSGMIEIAIDENAAGPSSGVFSQSVNSGATGTRSALFLGGGSDAGVLLVIKPQ